jgi:Photosystem I psaA/psaB protein
MFLRGPFILLTCNIANPQQSYFLRTYHCIAISISCLISKPQDICILMLSGNLWSKHGHFSKALSKGPNTTTWIWNFHADAHDFDIQHAFTRKVFASSLAHLSLVFLSIGGMHLHTAYFSSFYQWLKDPLHVQPSAHIVYQILNQDILNSDIGCNFQGIYITSGIFQLQLSLGLITKYHLQVSVFASIISSILCILGSYSKMHISLSSSTTTKPSTRCFKLCCTSNSHIKSH